MNRASLLRRAALLLVAPKLPLPAAAAVAAPVASPVVNPGMEWTEDEIIPRYRAATKKPDVWVGSA